MTNKELQDYLSNFDDTIQVKLRTTNDSVINLTSENVLLTSDTAFIDKTAPEDTWDCEDGKIDLGNGPTFLLINPIIL